VDAFVKELEPQALLFLLIATRLSGMMLVAPFFSSKSIPAPVKAGLIVLLSYISLPVVSPGAGRAPDGVVAFGLLAAKELVIGLAFGLIAQFLFAAVQMAGALIDINAGFAIANVIDPTSNLNITVLGRFYNMAALAAFIAIGGQQWLVLGISRSFELLPPFTMPNMSAIVDGVLARADDIILIALEIGAPLLVALFVADIALGIVSRSVPQMNVFMVGLPLKVVMALGGIAILLPAFTGFFGDLTGRMLADLDALIHAAVP
jgi:flagellar biosynthetic protein FliR